MGHQRKLDNHFVKYLAPLKTKRGLGFSFFIVAVFIASFFVSAFSPVIQQANARSASSMTLADQALSYATLMSLYTCLRDEGIQQTDAEGFLFTGWYVSDSHAKSGEWWRTEGNPYWGTTDGAYRPASYLSPNVRTSDRGGDGRTLCNNILKTGVGLWGYNGPIDILCEAGVKRADGGSCREGTDRFGDLTGSVADQIYNSIVKKVYGGNTPSLKSDAHNGYPGLYLLYRQAFLTGCQAKQSTSSADPKFVYNSVRIVKDDGSYDDIRFVGGIDKSTTRLVYTNASRVEINNSCEKIASKMNEHAKAYSSYRQQNTNEDTGVTDPGACNPDEDSSCVPADSPSSCMIEGIGWILCPVINAMAGMTDATFNLVAAFMEVRPLGFNTSDPLYKAWTVMQSVANVAFVIAFLIIIFSQLTGTGVSNYGVKKMLPRLVISAILVNISYFICALAVDVSNILGNSIQDVLVNTSHSIVDVSESPSDQWASLAVSVLSLGAIGGGVAIGATVFSSLGIWGMLAGLLPLLVTALFALIVAFLVLLARQAFIIILIVVAPLAFVAFLLPNTESLFNKWRSFFVMLLALFPMMALVFGGSVLASTIMQTSALADMANGDGVRGIIGFFMYLGSLAVLAIPFFITPVLIKLSGGVLNRFAGFINNPNKGPFDKMRKGAERIRDNSRNTGYARKLGSNRKVLGFGARRRVRKGLMDQSIQSQVGAAEASTASTDVKASNLLMRAGNADYLKSTLNAEQKADLEAQQDQTLSYRQSLASDRSNLYSTLDKARYEESKSTASSIGNSNPLAQQVQDARDIQLESDIAGNRLNSAKGVLQQEFAKELQDRSAVAQRAGGIDPRGASRVTAAAAAAIDEADLKAIKAEATMLSNVGVDDQLDATTGALQQGLNSIARDATATIDKRAAAVGRVAKVGGDDSIYSTLDYLASLPDGQEKTILQQHFASEVAGRKPYSIGAADFANLSQGKYSGNFTDKVVGRIQGGKLSADTVINGSADELKRIISAADTGAIARTDPHYEQLKSQIATYLATPTSKQPPAEMLELISKL